MDIRTVSHNGHTQQAGGRKGLMICIQRHNPHIKSSAVPNLPWLLGDLPGDVPTAGAGVILDMVVWNPGSQPGLDRQVAHRGKQQQRHENG